MYLFTYNIIGICMCVYVYIYTHTYISVRACVCFCKKLSHFISPLSFRFPQNCTAICPTLFAHGLRLYSDIYGFACPIRMARLSWCV